MSLGMRVGNGVSVAVAVIVAVTVGVPASVGTVSVVLVMPELRTRYTTNAPISRITTSAPKATGRLSVISGIRLASIPDSAFFDFVAAFVFNSVPHTRQRVAFSLKRVPQVGQICDF